MDWRRDNLCAAILAHAASLAVSLTERQVTEIYRRLELAVAGSPPTTHSAWRAVTPLIDEWIRTA